MEYLDALDRPGFGKSRDDRAAAIFARIAFRRHHDSQRHVRMPAQIEMRELAVTRRDKREQQVRLQSQHQDLAFGVAEADIVFDELRPRGRHHQAGIEDALERCAFGRQCTQRG